MVGLDTSAHSRYGLMARKSGVEYKKSDPMVSDTDGEKHPTVTPVSELDPIIEGKLTRRFDLFIIPMLGVSVARVRGKSVADSYHSSCIFSPFWTGRICMSRF